MNETDGSAPVLQVSGRSFAARTATFSAGELSMSAPAVLFAADSTDDFGNEFETLLTARKIETAKVQFVSSQNSMFHGERVSGIAKSCVVLPNAIPFSSSLVGVAKASKPGKAEHVFISTAAPEEMAGVLDRNSAIYVMANAAELAKFPDQLALAITNMRRLVGWRKLIYVPGVARQSNLALLFYAGADVVDSLITEMDTARGIAHIDGEELDAGTLDGGICHCTACASRQAEFLQWHNRFQLLDELNRVRLAIRRGKIRELAERRAVQSSWNVQFLRCLDTSHYDYFERVCANTGGSIFASSETSLRRADIIRYVKHITSRYVPPAGMKIALLVPCSRRKPYFRSKSHRIFREAVGHSRVAPAVHMLTVTSPLGIVPEELETVYPAAHYDIPVSGQWSEEEKSRTVGMLLELLKKRGYEMIISHLEDERDFVNASLTTAGVQFMDTSNGRTRERASLERLRSVLDTASVNDAPAWRERNRQFLLNMASYQFGRPGAALLEGALSAGRYPNLRIMRDGAQLGMLTEARGLISLTLDGAERIHRAVPGY